MNFNKLSVKDLAKLHWDGVIKGKEVHTLGGTLWVWEVVKKPNLITRLMELCR